MRRILLSKILAFVVTAMIAIPTVPVEASDMAKSKRTTTSSSRRTTTSTSRKSSSTTTTRDRSRTEKFRQMVDKPKTTTNSSTTKSSSKKSTSSSFYSTGTTTSSSSSSSGTDNTNRKIFLQNQIIDWKAKLAKAEKSYQECVASGEDTAEKKRVVESKQKTVDTCLEMIRTYEAELNSLK